MVTAAATDDIFRAISDPTRRSILDYLRDDELTAGEIVDRFEMTQSAVSQQLKILRDSRLVRVRQEGRYRYYRADPRPLLEIYNWVAHYEWFWRDKLDALGAVLDEDDDA